MEVCKFPFHDSVHIKIGPAGARISSPTLSSVSSRGSPTSAAFTLDDEVSAAPLPFFTGSNSGAVPLSPPASPRPILSPTSSINRMNVPVPLRSSNSEMMSPPRSPSRASPSVDLLQDEVFKLPKSSIGSPSMKPQPSPTSSVTPLGSALPSALDIAESALSKIRSSFMGKATPPLSTIPVFYTPSSSLLSSRAELSNEEFKCIDDLFSSSSSFESGERVISSSTVLEDLITSKLGLSRYFAEPMFKRLTKTNPYITRLEFMNYWRSHLVLGESVSNFFHVVKQDMNQYIARNDFRDFLWCLLDNHPGLSFLRDSPEFQERYADTVICRIFYHYDFRHTGKIYFRDINRKNGQFPSIIKSWLELDTTDDINTIRQFFSYEHFYVLYCKFWDLDADHDFLIDKDDLVKYDGHAFSPRAIERVFSETGFKFTSGIPGKMNYDDFVWFILSDEDKTTEMSLRFFFALIDLDGDGVIRDHEMLFFYEDQVHRLECINQEAPQFADIMCQMNDLIRPSCPGQFRIEDFLKRRKNNAGVFFSILLSLNKFMAYEQRDPFQIKQDLINNPDLTDWDRFCVGEYVRLAMEAGSSASNQQTQQQQSNENQTEFLRNVDGGGIMR